MVAGEREMKGGKLEKSEMKRLVGSDLILCYIANALRLTSGRNIKKSVKDRNRSSTWPTLPANGKVSHTSIAMFSIDKSNRKTIAKFTTS